MKQALWILAILAVGYFVGVYFPTPGAMVRSKLGV